MGRKKDTGKDVSHLKPKKIRRGWLLVNIKTGIHTHLRSEWGCACVKTFVKYGVTPDDDYLRESVRRMEMGKEQKRQRYRNRKEVGR